MIIESAENTKIVYYFNQPTATAARSKHPQCGSLKLAKWRDGEGALIHMLIIRLETVENHQIYCLMSSDNFIVRLRQESNLQPTEALVRPYVHDGICL